MNRKRELHNRPWLTDEYFDESQDNWGWESLSAFHSYIEKKIKQTFSCEYKQEELKRLLLWDDCSEKEFFYSLCNEIVDESQDMSDNK